MIGFNKCKTMGLTNILLVIGGINWGLIGVGYFLGNNWNVVNKLIGSWPMVENLVYLLVGIAAIVSLFGCRCKSCRT